MSTQTAVVWFRRDLRLADNPAWAAATQSADRVLALFVVDARVTATAGDRRRALVRAHLRALDEQLRSRGGGLLVRSGDPVELVPRVAAAAGAGSVHVNGDVSGYAQRRDDAVRRALQPDVAFDVRWGSHVHRPGSVVAGTGATHQVFTPYHRAWSSTPWEPWPEEDDAQVLDPSSVPGVRSVGPDPLGSAPPGAGPAGEAAAEALLTEWLDRVDDYPRTHDLPADEHGTSSLSADLHLGTLSPRHVVDVVGNGSDGRSAFVRQLAWRDWFASLFLERPSLARAAMRRELDAVAWRDDPEGVAAWQEGHTGVPIVDAGMRQLAGTGWMHNRVRLITASFLVKDLLVDWRVGERHFRRELVDGEVSQNAGNWQWVAGTGPDAAPYFRVLNPVTQSRRFDPDGEYIARWVPELAGLAPADRHAPWELGPLELAAAGVELGTDYPHRLVEHGAARERALAAYSAARAG